jgi:osmotically-inducible protein OsmY
MRRFFLLLFLLLLQLAAGCKAKDGDLLRQVARKAGEKLQGVTTPAGKVASTVRTSLCEASPAARAQTRLRWDRYLAGLDLQVRAGEPGNVVVAGKVPDAAARQRAIDLAKSTAGVENVVDEVKVAKEE